MDHLVKHVEKENWTSVEHYLRAGSSASKIYGVSGVPHILLIDKSGTIVYKGHPAKRRNLEEDIDTLLKGEALTGYGIASEQAERQQPKYVPEKGFKTIDLDSVRQEIEAFKDSCKAMSENDELKE
jgi:hypothetical protein